MAMAARRWAVLDVNGDQISSAYETEEEAQSFCDRSKLAGAHVVEQEVKVRWKVWGYDNGSLLPDGFVGEGEEGLLEAVCKLAESCGLEVCIAPDGDESVNPDVENWIESE